MDYFEYIQSPLWEERKRQYYRRFKKQCRACGSLKSIHLHHMRYSEQGKERDMDLMPLCELCHDEFHKIYGSVGSLKKNTRVFITQKQAYIRNIINMLK